MTSRLGILVFAVALSVSAYAMTEAIRHIDIPTGNLATGLEIIARVWGIDLIYSSAKLKGIRTKGLHGEYTASEAATKLLEGTNLTVTVHQSGGLLISDTAGSANSPLPPEPVSSKPIRVARAAGTSNTSSNPPAMDSGALEEILVTAQKQVQRLQDVPVPVTALNGEALLETGQLRLQDYYASVPGLNLARAAAGTTEVAIRGLYSDGNPTVSVIVDDVSIGSPSLYGGQRASFVPDIDPSELQRVEILRGPQGTLYGASSLGGLIKYVTIDPSAAGPSGRVQVDGSDIRGSGDAGFAVRASTNLPLSETWAMRASAFTRHDPGYVDNVLTGQKDINAVDVFGGHLSSFWRPSSVWSLKLNAIYENTRSYGAASSDPSLGDQNQAFVRGAGQMRQEVGVLSLTLSAQLGDAKLISITGYNIYRLDNSTTDFTASLGFVLPRFGVAGALDVHRDQTDKFTQENRVSMPLGQHVDWLAGVYYSDSKSRAHELWDAVDSVSGSIATAPNLPNMLDARWPTTFEEYAAFTDLTWNITRRFNIQLGGRESKDRQSYSEIDGGGYGLIFLGIAGNVVTPEVVTRDNSFTYLVTPQVKVSEDFMIYGRLASGYRPGGSNATCVPFGIPCAFGPDKTQNYEVGAKGQGFDHLLSFDASLYHIDWKDIQETVLVTGNEYIENTGRARSQGAELAVEVRPVIGLTVATWIAFSDAVLSRGVPGPGGAIGQVGDRLPYSSRWSGNLSATQTFSLSGTATGFIGAGFSYVGDRKGDFGSVAQGTLPSYTRMDLHAGLMDHAWNVTLYANNVTDKHGELSLPSVYFPGFTFIQPRTIGLSVARLF